MAAEQYRTGIPAHIETLLSELHARSTAQEDAIDPEKLREIRVILETDQEKGMKLQDELMVDKFIALDRDKCLFMYQLIIATGATQVVEIGTSFGVSTIYLALGVAHNAKVQGIPGRVIATEKEESKAKMAREYWNKAGKEVVDVIDLRVGDLTETLKVDIERVDLMLLDVWPYVAVPALNLLKPHMRDGAVLLTDNTIKAARRSSDLLPELRQSTRFRSITMPFTGGFEFSVYDRNA